MINFFRKTRKKMADDNRPLKYMRYAIGEIALVVIGILIAIQINNWNTYNKETKELLNHLKNIQNNLRGDLISLEEVSIFRDSSKSYSQTYLRIANKNEITIDDFSTIENSGYKGYYDINFEPRTSGFEMLKNSGFIGELSGTKIESLLNEYYYIVNKIIEREESLNYNIETLENIAFSENIQLRSFEIQNNTKNKEEYFSTHQKEIKELLNNPSMKGINFRIRGASGIVRYYKQCEQIAHELISEMDVLIGNRE